MATATSMRTYENLDQLFARLGDVPPIRVVMTPPPGTATEEDMLDLRERTGQLCELVDGTLVDKSPYTYPNSAAALLDRLGVPPERVRLSPPPGMATEEDMLDLWDRRRVLCELVDGTLVEKVMGHVEGYLGAWLSHFIMNYLAANPIGYCVGADGMMRIAPHLVRMPDVAFISWQRLGQRKVPPTKVPNLVPDLAIEVISAGNSPKEMRTKLHEYFDCGVPLVWYVYPEDRSARAYTSPEAETIVDFSGQLDGGTVLPGFALPLATLFADLE